MINSVGNNFVTSNDQTSDTIKDSLTVDKKVSDLPSKEVVNKLDQKDLTIKDQVAMLANEPPVNQDLINEIRVKVEQGRYPIDLDVVTEKMLESFKEAQA